MSDQPRPRLRDFGHRIGTLEPGPHNAITDVSSVRVGQTTLIDEERGVYSGVTAVVPDGLRQAPALPAGLFVANGYGKFVGATQVMELGELETPLLLTSTLSAFRVADSLLSWLLDHAERPITSVNPVVGEINDTWLSSAEPRPVTQPDVYAALDGAHNGPVALGNTGGGTGACALGFKAGIGSASRLVPLGDGRAVTVGTLVQANMGGDLRLLGQTVTPERLGVRRPGYTEEKGSCVVLVAVDTPLPARQLTRIAARGVFALGRAGASFGHGSGDYGVAFSSEPSQAPRNLRQAELDAVFRAVLEAVEESVIDALLAARTVHAPHGRVATALPHQLIPRV